MRGLLRLVTGGRPGRCREQPPGRSWRDGRVPAEAGSLTSGWPGGPTWTRGRLLPTPDVRRTAFGSRAASAGSFTQRTGDPLRAEHNSAVRDTLFTERLHEETARLGLHPVTVHGTLTEDELAERVSEIFRL
ncbi:hypothetical protein ACFWJ5_35545 [Streptomyces qaidamensis]|uniref:hypothetical protein n=1 Tax=Streptomyces qaidamensis TaxID=1783515 RepID=UPI0036586366